MVWGAGVVAAVAYLLGGVLRRKKGWFKLTPALFCAAAVLPASPTGAAAFLACAAGDALLLDKDRFFLHGLGSFLVAHLLFVPTFWAPGDPNPPLALTATVVLLVGGMLALLVPRLRGTLQLAIPAYGLAIGAMTLAAGSAGPLATAGALSFAVSDAVLAFNRFVRPFAAAEIVIMSTYYAAILLMAAALLP